MKDVQNVQKRGQNRERCGDQVDSFCILAGPLMTSLRLGTSGSWNLGLEDTDSAHSRAATLPAGTTFSFPPISLFFKDAISNHMLVCVCV